MDGKINKKRMMIGVTMRKDEMRAALIDGWMNRLVK